MLGAGRVPGGFLEVEALELSFEVRRGGYTELGWWCGIGQCSGLGGCVQGVTPECTKAVSICLLRMGQRPWSMMEVPPGGGVLGIGCVCSMDRGAWQGTVHGVTESWTLLSDYTFSSHRAQTPCGPVRAEAAMLEGPGQGQWGREAWV